jgi:hypothetical protein
MAALQRLALPAPRILGRPRPGSLLVVAALVALVAVALVQVNQLGRMTGKGYQIDELNRERAARRAENREVEAQVARLSSLARVDWDARVRLGMVPAARKLHIAVNATVPEHQALPPRFLPAEAPPAPPPAAGRPWWKRALDLLPF